MQRNDHFFYALRAEFQRVSNLDIQVKQIR